VIVGAGEIQIARSVHKIEIDLLGGHSVSTPTEVSVDSVIGLRVVLKEADSGTMSLSISGCPNA
jgi:hypothetical protein